MRIRIAQLYTIAELQEQFPDGYRAALAQYQRDVDRDPYIPWQDEIADSLKAVYEAAGVSYSDLAFGVCYRGTGVRIKSDGLDIAGRRAWAWLENNLLSGLRVPFKGKRRWEVSKYGAAYRAGVVPPCPLTGYCADEDFLDSLRESIKDGATVKDALSWLPAVAARLLESELEYQRSEEAFFEEAACNLWEYDSEGNRV